MPDPIVSVVIPCYNGSSFIEACISSVWQQNVACEVILVDDGSTDDSLSRALSAMRQAPAGAMWVMAQANQGPAAARNAGLRAARGRYVCFLDVDDQYAPGFFAAGTAVLDQNPALAAVTCRIEFVGSHREIQSWQREAMEASAPGNQMVQTEIARRVGGFPTDPAFRGPTAGEDVCFRKAVSQLGRVVMLDHPYLRYVVRAGSHFDFFLDRAVYENGKFRLTRPTPQESDGSFERAVRQYQDDVTSRVVAWQLQNLQIATMAASECHRYTALSGVGPGTLEPPEGYAMCCLAWRWPLEGKVVEIGSMLGPSTYWLATGCKGRNREKLLVIVGDPQVLHTVPRDSELADQLDIRIDATVLIEMEDPVRMVSIGPALPVDALASAISAWSSRLMQHGVIAMPNVNQNAEIVRLYSTMLANPTVWRPILKVQHLAAFEKLI